MARWEGNARGRLERAALDLFSEQGYDRTTVAQIAQRANLTERSFYRWFADKREVLFGGSEELEKHLGVKLVPDDEESEVDTIGGLIFSMLGRVPARGELIRHPTGVEFEVLDADPRRVKKLKVHPPRSLSATSKSLPEPPKA